MESLPDIFEQTVQCFPDKTAVACREEQYTFAELEKVSRRLGQRIAESDPAACRQADRIPADGLPDALQPEPAPIGVMANRGVDTVAFFLAILYSGNFYVPVDPDLPREKMARIFADAGFRTVLCAEENREALSELGFAGEILTMADAARPGQNVDAERPAKNVDAERPAQNDDAEENAAGARERLEGRLDAGHRKVSPDSPAYMIYTSGSTGQPKGVLKSHGAVIDFMETYIRLFDLGPEEIIGNQTPFFFDASAKDFYLMLFTGATLEILPSELFALPVTLIEYLNELHINYICWVPSALSVVTQLNTFQQVVPADLTNIFFVGETFPVKQLRKWMEALPDARYVNLYGQTEIAGVCCYCELPVPFGKEEIPLGQPLPNCRVFLRDEEGNFIAEPGRIGELCVVSDALAMEYYHDPARTAEAFVALTLPDGTQARALRTGDLARYGISEFPADPDVSNVSTDRAKSGNLYFVSRGDAQIKHMGYRIELGEIESAANEIPEIARGCCLYQEEKDRICLFCELVPGCDWDKKALRRALRERLSEYMLPGKYYILDAIPLNANGKVDRARLKEML